MLALAEQWVAFGVRELMHATARGVLVDEEGEKKKEKGGQQGVA